MMYFVHLLYDCVCILCRSQALVFFTYLYTDGMSILEVV
jgi:hypothetical protein